MPDQSRHLWHSWLSIERVLRAILTERWSREQWKRIKVEIPKVLAERNRIKRTGWFIHENARLQASMNGHRSRKEPVR